MYKVSSLDWVHCRCPFAFRRFGIYHLGDSSRIIKDNIPENGFPISWHVFKSWMNFSCASSVAMRFFVAISGVTLRHSRGRCLAYAQRRHHLDGPTCEVGLGPVRSLEEHSMVRLEFAKDLETLVCCSLFLLIDMMRCFPIDTPLDPSSLPIRSVHHPIPLGTSSWKGLAANALRTRDRKPLRSTSRRLGLLFVFVLGIPATSSWWGLAADRTAFRIPLVGPSRCCTT